MTPDLKEKMAYIAIELFGRQYSEKAPEAGYYCLEAKPTTFSGPWFKYGNGTHWNCGLCATDPYLSEYGDTYLLSGAGMGAILDALVDKKGLGQIKLEALKNPKAWCCQLAPVHSIAFGSTAGEALVYATFALLSRLKGLTL